MPNLHNSVVTPTRAMSQTPRTPHPLDNAPLTPAGYAEKDDDDDDDDEAHNDENVPPENVERRRPGRPRSPNWLECELVCAFLCRQFAARDKGSQSKKVQRCAAAANAYQKLLKLLNTAGLCAWSEGKVDKQPTSLTDSVNSRTAAHVQGRIWTKGDEVRTALKTYTQVFGRLYPQFSKNGYDPGTGDNDRTNAWSATEQACATELKDLPLLGVCRTAFRIVCSSSPHLPACTTLHTYIDAVFALDPSQRLKQDDVPTEKDLKQHQKQQMKEAATDMAYGQLPNSAAIEREEKLTEDLSALVKTCQDTMADLRNEMGRDADDVAQKAKELEEQKQRLEEYEERIAGKLSALESMELRMNAMLSAAAAANTVNTSPAHAVATSPARTSSPKVTAEMSAITEEEGVRRSARPRKRKNVQD